MSNEKVFVQLGNKVLQINADMVDRYVAKGFDVVNQSGVVIQQSIPNDYGTLRMMYEQKLDEIESLKRELEAMKRASVKSKKSAEPIVEPVIESVKENVAEIVEKAPKTTKRTSRNKSK